MSTGTATGTGTGAGTGRGARDWSLWSTTARLVVTDPRALDDAHALAVDLLAEVDLAASRFRDDSELCAVDAAAGEEVAISPLLAHLMRVALEAARQTDGDVDPCLGHRMRALGYDRDLALLSAVPAVSLPVRAATPQRSDALLTSAGHRVVVSRALGWRDVELTRADGADVLRVPAGLGLDLGATAKAAAADLVAAAIHDELGVGALVSLGGDLATAGPGPAHTAGHDWQVLVGDGPGEPEGLIALPAGSAVATSSTLRRRWSHDGQVQHHVLDPRTGRPAAEVWRTVSVAAETCARANTVTTAALVRGEAALGWLRELGLPARLVAQDGSVVRLGGWPADA